MGVASRKTYWILCTFARPSISQKLRPTGIKLLLWMNINVEDLQTELWTVCLTQWQTRKLHSLDLLSRKTQGTQGIIMDRLTIVVLSCFWSVLSSDWFKNYARHSLSGPKISRFFVNQSEVFILLSSVFPRFSPALRVLNSLNSDWFFLIVCLVVIGQISQKAAAASIFFCVIVALIGQSKCSGFDWLQSIKVSSVAAWLCIKNVFFRSQGICKYLYL